MRQILIKSIFNLKQNYKKCKNKAAYLCAIIYCIKKIITLTVREIFTFRIG